MAQIHDRYAVRIEPDYVGRITWVITFGDYGPDDLGDTILNQGVSPTMVGALEDVAAWLQLQTLDV